MRNKADSMRPGTAEGST
jgi:hypothetical protein